LEQIGYYINTGALCKEKRGFKHNREALALYVHEGVEPFTLEAPEPKILETEGILNWIGVSVTHA